MVIRCFVIYIQKVVIQITYAALCADPVKTDGFKSQIGHNGVDIVCKCLIDFDEYLFSRYHAS